jgi:hypothetical protein
MAINHADAAHPLGLLGVPGKGPKHRRHGSRAAEKGNKFASSHDIYP